jgi:O-antigen ligase
MILVVAIAAGYWRNLGAVGARQLCLASISATTAILALGLTGSRTAWVTFIAFGALLLLGQRPKLSLVVFVVIAAASVIVVAPGSLRESIEDTYEWRVDSKLSGEPEADAITKFRAVDAGRLDKWIGGLETLAERPWLIPFGGGFNNYRYSVEAGISAHNMYITLVGEVGIVGLFFYLKWLLSVRRRSLRLTGLGVKLGERGRKVFLPVEMNNLLIAMMVSLLAGEVLFPYRPAFSFMGMFLFLCSVMNNSALVWGERTQPVSAAAAGRLQVGTGMFRPAPRRTPGLVVWPSHRLDKGAVQ